MAHSSSLSYTRALVSVLAICMMGREDYVSAEIVLEEALRWHQSVDARDVEYKYMPNHPLPPDCSTSSELYVCGAYVFNAAHMCVRTCIILVVIGATRERNETQFCDRPRSWNLWRVCFSAV